MSNLKYDTNENPNKAYEWALYSFQQILAILVATILIAQICHTPISSCFVGAGLGTLIYQLCTQFKSPMFLSSCGATSSAVIGALALGNTNNYLAVFIGGIVIALVYIIFAILIEKKGIDFINKLFPPILVGSVTMVIGFNLVGFIPSYVNVGSEFANWNLLVAFVTMLIIVVSSHYFKGFAKTIPFLFGLIGGYLCAVIITVCGIPLINFEIFKQVDRLFCLPDFAFLHFLDCEINWATILQILLLFVPVSICSLLEHYSDHKVLSNIIEKDLTKEPGLSKTLMGNGIASAVGTLTSGLPVTSYGESIATTGFSRVASVKVISLASVIMICLGFILPVQIFLSSIPSCVFGGCSMILYGYIIASGLKTLINNKIDLDNNKNLLIVSAVLTIGVSGVAFTFGTFNFSGVALAMIVGLLLNSLILKNQKQEKNDEQIQQESEIENIEMKDVEL